MNVFALHDFNSATFCEGVIVAEECSFQSLSLRESTPRKFYSEDYYQGFINQE